MRTALALLCLITASASSATGQVPSSGPNYLQVLLQVDSTMSSAIAVEGNEGTYWFDPTAVINLEQVQEAAVEQHSVDGVGFVISLHLTETGLEKLSRHWDELEGHSVGVIVGSRLLAAPLLLRSGSPQIFLSPGSLSLRQATELVTDLNTRIDRMRQGGESDV
jgi:hypothetical protein